MIYFSGFRTGGFHIPANGKGIVPLQLFNNVNGAHDPRYNHNLNGPYNNYRNRYGQFGQYNSLAPYPYDPRYNLNNPWAAPASSNLVKKA